MSDRYYRRYGLGGLTRRCDEPERLEREVDLLRASRFYVDAATSVAGMLVRLMFRITRTVAVTMVIMATVVRMVRCFLNLDAAFMGMMEAATGPHMHGKYDRG